MNSNQKPILIIILISTIIGLGIVTSVNSKLALTKSMNIYSAGLEYYKESNYTKAFKTFGKISHLSTLKPAAMYRQARALEQTGHFQRAILTYNILALRYPNFQLTPKSKYNAAKLSYDIGKYNQAKKLFREVSNKYSETEYATASEYYLGMIEYKNSKNIQNNTQKLFTEEKALIRFRQYLDNAPGGRYAQNSINRIKELQNNKLSREDNYLIAKSYYALYDYNTASKYFSKTDIPLAWADIVKNDYELKNYSKLRALTERGLMEYSYNIEPKEVHKAIDLYLSTLNSKTEGVKTLLNLNKNANGYDYLLYLNCKNTPQNAQAECYKNIYFNYQNGQFAADALYNMFYDAIKQKQYLYAKNLGEEHLKLYPHTNSTPAVMFWLAKVHNKLKYYNVEKNYYDKLLKEYPDDYYAFQAYLESKRIENPILKTDITEKKVMFPYKMNNSNDMIVKLAMLEDYSLLKDICEKDKFIQSWLEYQKGEYSKSAVIARDAMAELKEKPHVDDLRWRLVYPIHYYKEIKQFAGKNNPVIILSLVREESYFNPAARSSVGAQGLMQLMPQTANDIADRNGIKYFELYKPSDNLKIGNLYYAYLKNILHGKDFFVILAYNGGFNAVNKWKDYLDYEGNNDFLEQVPYQETQNYLKKVMKSYWNYIRLY
ncbi:transglycosylase SLT domain-containing protein [bacterium]|nr:transglycosylase SLT domain-containing protein [bacterium]